MRAVQVGAQRHQCPVGVIFPVTRGSRLRPDPKADRKQPVRIRTSRPEGPKLKAKRTCNGQGRFGEK